MDLPALYGGFIIENKENLPMGAGGIPHSRIYSSYAYIF